jgi:hypothetical protein
MTISGGDETLMWTRCFLQAGGSLAVEVQAAGGLAVEVQADGSLAFVMQADEALAAEAQGQRTTTLVQLLSALHIAVGEHRFLLTMHTHHIMLRPAFMMVSGYSMYAPFLTSCLLQGGAPMLGAQAEDVPLEQQGGQPAAGAQALDVPLEQQDVPAQLFDAPVVGALSMVGLVQMIWN